MILEQIEQETGVSKDKLLKIAETASHRYRTYRIPKRTFGYRIISHPTPDLKFLQRWLNRNIFSKLPVHESALAYRNNIGIVDNARLHSKNNYLLKIDFLDFFPSLKRKDIKSIIETKIADNMLNLTEKDIEIVLNIVCKNDSLTIGAPSSPVLSNAMLYDFDCFISALCAGEKITYSRYADDIFSSTNQPNKLSGLLPEVRKYLRDISSLNLVVNEQKTVFTSKKRLRIVTGVNLTPSGTLSIGRRKKRQLRTMIYLYSINELPPDKVSYLRGYLAFSSSVEPEFLIRVRQKYGNDTITRIMREIPVTRKKTDQRQGH